MRRTYDNEVQDSRKKRTQLRKDLTEAENDLEDWKVKGIGFGAMDEDDKKTYEQEKFRRKEKVRQKKADLKELEEKDILKSFDYEDFSNFLKNADAYWKKAGAEQKHQLARFLFSNIIVDGETVQQLAYKPLIAKLFVVSGGPGWT